MQKKKKQNEKTTPEAPRKVGRPRSYTPEALEAKFEEYLSHVKSNPLIKQVASKAGPMDIEVRNPLTLVAFCVFAGITRATFCKYEERQEFINVIARVRETIEADQLVGAMAGLYDSAIVSRVLKLADRQDITTDGKSIQQTTAPINVSLDADAAKIIQSIGKMTSEE